MSHAHEIVNGLVKEGSLSFEAAERARASAAGLLEKVAVGLPRLTSGQGMLPSIASHMGGGAGKAGRSGRLIENLMADPVGTAPSLVAGGAAITAGGLGAGYVGHHAMAGADAIIQALMKGRRFDKMMKVNPELDGYEDSSLQLAFNTLHKFNPEMASDPLVAGTFVRRVMDARGVDTKTVGEIARARGDVPGMSGGQKAGDMFTRALSVV